MMISETCAGCGHPIRPPYKPVWTWEDATDGMISGSGTVTVDVRRSA